MSKYECDALILSVVIAIIGVSLSFLYKSGDPFARSGAAITVVAIVFGSYELRKRLEEAPSLVEEQLQESKPDVEAMCKEHGLSPDATTDAFERIANETRKEVKEAIKSASRRVLRVEVSLLVAGTVIWGFGDIFVKALLCLLYGS